MFTVVITNAELYSALPDLSFFSCKQVQILVVVSNVCNDESL